MSFNGGFSSKPNLVIYSSAITCPSEQITRLVLNPISPSLFCQSPHSRSFHSREILILSNFFKYCSHFLISSLSIFTLLSVLTLLFLSVVILKIMIIVMIVAVSSNIYLRALRSEEHTSELQSRPHLVCRLLLEKKK